MFKAWCLTPGADFRGSLGSDNVRETWQTVVLVTVRPVKTHGKTAGVHSGTRAHHNPASGNIQIPAALTVGGEKKAGFSKTLVMFVLFGEGPR